MNIHSTENNLSNLLDKNEQALYLFRSEIVLILLQKHMLLTYLLINRFFTEKQLSTPSALVISVLNFMGG
ncbi:hypothetical protein GQC79_001504 [Salmonella enterica]|nr:hypothetical protein [Salmonella enterica]